jgi:hypothetical protein
MSGKRGVVLNTRDHALIRAAWSLGWVTARALTDLVSPATAPKTLAGRLTELTDAGYLRRRRIVTGVAGHHWLYGSGRNAPGIDPAYRDAWRPSDAQLGHTLTVGETLVAITTPGRLGALHVTAWQGEAELRTWHDAGTAIPDLLVRVSGPSVEDACAVEVDRGTQARAAWRRKLLRYLHTPRGTLLVVTTSDERARNIARLARDMGVPALTTDRHALGTDAVVRVYDAARGCRRPVDDGPPT